MITSRQRFRVFQLITNFGPGGAQRVFHDHCQFLSQYYDIEEVVFDDKELPNLFESKNKLHSLDVRGGGGLLTKLINLHSRRKNLLRLVKQRSPRLIISHLDGANWINVLSFAPARKILVLHGSVIYDEETGRLERLFKKHFILPFLYNLADVTVTVSEGIGAELENCGVKNVVSIPNFFNLKQIQDKAKETLPDPFRMLFENNQVLITSGRLAPPKQHKFMLEVFAVLKQQKPQLKLVLLGDGPLREMLLHVSRELKLKAYDIWSGESFNAGFDVFFLGYVSNPFAYLCRSRLFIFPSKWEGFPMALCEAMVCKVPVIAADCPTGPRQILAPGSDNFHYNLQDTEITKHGALLPKCDHPNALGIWVSAIIDALNNPILCLDWVAAAEKRMQMFEKENIMEQWTKLIDRVVHGKTDHPAQI